MPDALIVIDKKDKIIYLKEVVDKMVKIGLIKRVSVGGVKVYGRHYLSARAIRQAYNKKVSN